MAIGKRLRFEIFKRDRFVCQYCGAKPPSVVLEVDHVEPKSLGGVDDEPNLITSCLDCNRGKGAVPLRDRVKEISFGLEIQQERLDQRIAYQKFLEEKAEKEGEWVEVILERWAVLTGQNPDSDEWSFYWELEPAVRKFVKLLAAEEIIEAAQIAFGRYPNATQSYQFKFFCGICWRKIRGSGVLVTSSVQTGKD